MFHTKRHEIGSCFIDVRRSPGKGEAIILIHGIGVSGNYFMPFAKLLARDYDVHVLDMPGYGKTPTPPHPLAPFEQADVAAKYIQKMGLGATIIVGQSMGCQTAAQLARRHPRLCKKLLLIGPTVNKWERTLPWQAFRLLVDTFREPFRMNVIILHDYLHMGPIAYLATTRFMIADRIEESLGQMLVPVCIVRGGRDGIAPAGWVEYLAKITKQGEARHILGAAHNVQFSKPKELLKACETFLRK
jgi:pimeloyl-ACP methyl ester carboxylesterase